MNNPQVLVDLRVTQVEPDGDPRGLLTAPTVHAPKSNVLSVPHGPAGHPQSMKFLLDNVRWPAEHGGRKRARTSVRVIGARRSCSGNTRTQLGLGDA